MTSIFNRLPSDNIPTINDTKKPCYVLDKNLIHHCNRLPAVCDRATLVHDLIESYELTKKLQVVQSTLASYEDLRKFHSELYIDYLKTITDLHEDYMPNAQDEEFGIGYDCPPVSNMYELVSVVAGGSITAARCLVLGMTDIAINWCGGWHHAQRFAADGFCYVNDIVLAIETLKAKFPKVLYIDLDIHHGNGVQDAYNLSKTVFTLSLHKFEPGFYPGTGGIEDIGTLAGKGYACNFPLHAWYSDDTMEYIFTQVFPMVFDSFSPDAIVVQCGADALAHDPQGGAKMTVRGYCSCIAAVLDKRKPTLLLGGGGYKHTNVARLWTSITALVVGEKLDEDIPEHEHWTKYGPDYKLAVEPMLTKDTNKKDYLDQCIQTIRSNLETYLCASTTTIHAKLKTISSIIDNSSTQGFKTKRRKESSAQINHLSPTKQIQEKAKSDQIDIYDFVD